MDIDCPECGHNNEVDGEDLPLRACDDTYIECEECDEPFKIGWYATIELR